MLPKNWMAICAICPIFLFANPQNPTVMGGSAKFEGMQTPELIIHAGDRAILHWDSFSIGANETTRFIQASPNDAVLNRVTGLEASHLLGQLLSDGKIYLINPNGVIVGKESLIDVGSFIASSFDLSDSAFLNDQSLVFEGSSLQPLINEGTIRAKNGDLLLLAHRIENKGTLSAKEGSVLLGAGHRILVGVEGKKFLYVNAALPGDGIENQGKVEALKTVLESNSSPFALGIRNSGEVRAMHLVEENGEVYLRCKGSNFENSGNISANRGAIYIEAEDSLAQNEGSIDAPGGYVSIHAFSNSSSLADQKPFGNQGRIDVSDVEGEGGSIFINAPKFANEGKIAAKGSQGKISIFVPGSYIETASAQISADGEGGKIRILTGNYFTSGSLSAKGEIGGSIAIRSERFHSHAGRFDCQGTKEGGRIQLIASSPEYPLHLNPHVILDVSGEEKGGTVELLSPLQVTSQAQIKLDGKEIGTLTVPSTLSIADSFPDFVDPNPNQESLFWTVFAVWKEEALASLQRQDWIEGFSIPYFDLNQLPTVELAAVTCPPSGIEYHDFNPSGTSSSFGNTTLVLSTGNVVVTKPNDSFGGAGAGAVYLYNGATGALISNLRGSTAGDGVGTSLFAPSSNNYYVVISSSWTNGGASSAGAVTFGNGTTGVSGVVSAGNSLVGTTINDQVGFGGVIGLVSNGNYVVLSPNWNNGAATAAGAVTWGNGLTGVSGAVGVGNSLIGTTINDQVGSGGTAGAVALNNGHYVVSSPNWTNGGAGLAGAATWGNGTAGITGAVTSANSLVGTTANDQVSLHGITALLVNNNYVVCSGEWTNGANMSVGAATWGNGATGITGSVTSGNSLVGTTINDQVGSGGATALTNGHYVVASSNWNNGASTSAGAATWGNGTTGITGPVTSGNSLVGTTTNDRVSNTGVVALSNNHYVVGSNLWNNGAATSTGAATWGNGGTGIVGPVTTGNSLHGAATGDRIGLGITALLTNGNYVVTSTFWNGNTGSATWGNGTSGTTGTVGVGNSLVGSTGGDQVSNGGVTTLTNGNYVVVSSNWRNGAAANAGATTWGNGSSGVIGSISASNSFVGSLTGDHVGNGGVLALTGGNYAVSSSLWNDGSTTVGAVTWGNGTSGSTGAISAANSFVGSTANDSLGSGNLAILSSSQFIFSSPSWTDGANLDAGAVTIVNSANGTVCNGSSAGAVSTANSFVGANANSGLSSLTSSSIGTTSTAIPIAIVQFTDYGGQTRVFGIEGGFVLPPSPPSPTPSGPSGVTAPVPTSQGLHNFAVAITETFCLFNLLSLANTDLLFPPQGTIWAFMQPKKQFPVIEYRNRKQAGSRRRI